MTTSGTVPTTRRNARSTKDRLLRAAEYLFIRRGYAATTVDQICARAGATKGAFFHHFKNKEELGLACGTDHSVRRLGALERPLRGSTRDAVGRLFDYLDYFSQVSTQDELPGCLIGVFALELAAENDRFRMLATERLDLWSDTLETLIRDALEETGRSSHPAADAKTLADYALATFQGAFVVAKARGDNLVVSRTIDELRLHLVERVLPRGAVTPRPRTVAEMVPA